MRDKLTTGQGNVDVVVQQINHEDEQAGLEQACSQVIINKNIIFDILIYKNVDK